MDHIHSLMDQDITAMDNTLKDLRKSLSSNDFHKMYHLVYKATEQWEVIKNNIPKYSDNLPSQPSQ